MKTPFSIGSRVIRSDGLLATVIHIHDGLYELEYDEGGTGWWTLDSLEWVNEPEWVEFSAALGESVAVTAFAAAIRDSAPVDFLMFGVGLGQASQGDPRAFLVAWNKGRVAELISEALSDEVVALAETHHLPGDFVDALTAPIP